MNEPEVIDAVVEPGTEIAEVPAAGTLFRTDDPVQVLERATEIANALNPVIRGRKLFAKIGAKDHITVEGWQTLGAMLGVTPVCTSTDERENGWEARVEARTLDGRVIGAAEAECLRSEERWKDSEDYAIRSMAQTRATSKALASVLRFVVTLAGYSGTPAEDMDGVKHERDVAASEKQIKFLEGQGNRQGLFAKAMLGPGQQKAFVLWASKGSETLSRQGASKLISALKEKPEEGREKILAEIVKAAGEGDELGLKCRALLSDDVPVDLDDADAGVGDPEDLPFS